MVDAGGRSTTLVDVENTAAVGAVGVDAEVAVALVVVAAAAAASDDVSFAAEPAGVVDAVVVAAQPAVAAGWVQE